MCSSAYARREEIRQFLHNNRTLAVFDTLLSDTEWDEVKDFIDLLKPFADATVQASARLKPTIHMARSILLYIGKHLTATAAEADKVDWVKTIAAEMKTKLAASLVKSPSWTSILAAVASALDPRKKDSGIPTLVEKDALRTEIRRRLREYETACAVLPANTAESVGRLSIFEMDIVESCGSTEPLFDEVESFFGSQREPMTVDILQYWNSRKQVYPKMARLAADILGICSSSVASESWFSVGGKTIADVRNRLGKDTVEALICLRSWKTVSGDVKVMEVD